jgi:hypothetical protein
MIRAYATNLYFTPELGQCRAVVGADNAKQACALLGAKYYMRIVSETRVEEEYDLCIDNPGKVFAKPYRASYSGPFILQEPT